MKTVVARSVRCALVCAPRIARLRTILLATVAFGGAVSAGFAQTNNFTGGANPLNPQSGN